MLCGFSVVEPILFIGEVVVELLNDVVSILVAYVPVSDPGVVVCIDGVIFPSVDDVSSVPLFSAAGFTV